MIITNIYEDSGNCGQNSHTLTSSTSSVRPVLCLAPCARTEPCGPIRDCSITSNLERIAGDFNLVQTPFPGHLSKVWPLSRDQWCGTVNSRPEEAQRGSLQRKGSFCAPLTAEPGPRAAPSSCMKVLGFPTHLITCLGSSTHSAHE